MKTITPQQLKALHAMLRTNKMEALKADLVYGFSGGRTESSKELSMDEARELLVHLDKGAVVREGTNHGATNQGEKMRRQVIAIFHEMGAHLPSTTKIDMARVNEWCANQGHGKKPLNDYTYDELPKLVGQAKKYLEWYLGKM
jgi:hypothetical protein